MDEVVARFQKAANAFDASLHEISSDDAWRRPTPCSEWDVRGLVQHVVNELAWVAPLIEGKTIADVGGALDGDLLGSDPLGAFHHHCNLAHAALEEPGALDRTVHLSFGDFSATYYADQVGGDILIHSWDLATGLGLDDALPEELLPWAQRWADDVRAQFGDNPAFSSPIPVADDADPQTRVLATLGRQRG